MAVCKLDLGLLGDRDGLIEMGDSDVVYVLVDTDDRSKGIAIAYEEVDDDVQNFIGKSLLSDG